MFKKENLRKNFLRVKQIADQNLGRAEKSEVLSEDQQGSEKRVEIVRQVTNNLIKRVTALLEAPPGTDIEKRLKKLPETSLSHTLIESATLLGSDTLLGVICQQCGECESAIAREELQCELDIEKDVLTHLQYLAEIEIPSVLKLRKQLTKSTLDMDSAKTRFNTAVRQSHVPGANMATAAAKADQVRDEYDEACNKVESIKDNLSIELCNFMAKESDHSSRLVALLEAQATYHKKALKYIEEYLPKMKQTIEESANKPVFGMRLEEHLKKMGRDISLVLEACILTLLETGMEEEGLFRIAGSAIKLKKLRACFDAQVVDMEEFSTDPHTVAGVLKQYLRELPEPMLTFDLHPEFMRATQLPPEQRLQALKAAVNKLPPSNYNNIRYLIKFLALLAEKSHLNKMTPSNIAIVMGPNLLWAKGESTPNMLTAGTVSAIVEVLIINCDDFFPGELDFHLTGHGCAPPSPSMLTYSASKAHPMLNVSDAEDDSKTEEKGGSVKAKEGENTLVQIATGEAKEACGIAHEHSVVGLDPVPQMSVESLDASEEGPDDVWVRRGAPEIDFSVSSSYLPDSPAQDLGQESLVMSASSPAVITYSSNAASSPNTSFSSAGSPVPNNAAPTAKAESLYPSLPGDDSPESSSGSVSPKFQRRVTKKPAPPPPPERSYNVAVTASIAKTSSGNSGYSTVPRLSSHHHHAHHQPPTHPDPSAEAAAWQAGAGDRPSPPERRTSGHDRPHGPPPERPQVPERPHAPPPERPRVQPSPQQAAPQAPGTPGHQRSASTGAMYISTTTAAPTAPNPDRG